MTAARKLRKREQVIAALLLQPTIAEAAHATGLGEKTLRRWLRSPDFAGEYRAARRQALEVAISSLQQATGEAVATLRRNLNAPTPQSVQVRAALGILEQAVRGTELFDLTDRVAALEENAREDTDALTPADRGFGTTARSAGANGSR